MSGFNLTTLLIDAGLGAALFVALYRLLRQRNESQHSGSILVMAICCLCVTLIVFGESFFLFFTNSPAVHLNPAVDTPPPDLQSILQLYRPIALVLVVVGALTSLCLALRNIGASVTRLREENSALSAATKLSASDAEILRKRQKMEMLGHFTGRIGHQFNNMLSIILTNAEMGEIKLESDSASKKYFTTIQKTVNKSRLLVQRLVAFSRFESSIKTKNLDLNKLIKVATEMMSTLLPDDIELSHQLPEESFEICGIEPQLQQLLVNLIAFGKLSKENCRGNINISVTKALTLPKAADKNGEYVEIKIVNSSSEITPAALKLAFSQTIENEIFNSSESLSLYVAQEIVQNHNGFLEAGCLPGHGVQLAIYLPYLPNPGFAAAVQSL